MCWRISWMKLPNQLTKRQLKKEIVILKELISRHGNVTLYEALDRATEELDLYRGCGLHKSDISTLDLDF